MKASTGPRWLLSVICGLAFLAGAWGCIRPSPEEPGPKDTLQVQILRPTEGAHVADSVEVLVSAPGAAAVELACDGRSMGRIFEPPWRFSWDTAGLADSSLHSLLAIGWLPDGTLRQSDRRTVVVRRNTPPTVRLLWPSDGIWLEAGEDTAVWKASVVDSTPGPQGISIEWTLDGETVASGTAVVSEPPRLSPGAHTVSVLVRDSWGASSCEKARVTVRLYEPADSPVRVVQNLLLAVATCAAERFAGCFSQSTRLCLPWGTTVHATPAGIEQAAGSVLRCPLVVEAPAARVEMLRYENTEKALVELMGVSIHPGSSAAPEQWPLHSAWRFVLSKENSSSLWAIEVWWDLHGATGQASSGPALTTMLSEQLPR